MNLRICCFLLALPSLAAARDLSLEQALELAVQHSHVVRRAQAQSRAAEAELHAARAERWPLLSAATSINYISDVPTLSIQLPAGPSLEREIGSSEYYQADLRITLPIFSGGRIGSGIELAAASRNLNEALESGDRERLGHQTRVEYYGLYRATRLVEVAQASSVRAATIDRNVHSLYDAGAADSVALLDAALALSRAELAVSLAQTNRRVYEIRLALLLGLALSDTLTLSTKIEEPENPPATAAVSSSKPELRTAMAAAEMASARYRVARAEYYPSLAAFGGYSYGKPNLDRFGNRWNDYFTVGVALSWSFNLGGRTVNRTRAASFALESARAERSQVEETLQREINLALEQLGLAYRRYQHSRAEYQIATDHFRLAQAQHSDGVLSSNRLLEIESDLTAADASMAVSLSDYHIARSALLHASGLNEITQGSK